jgi:two-component system, OmpR family, sensor histidine kinase KdpD
MPTDNDKRPSADELLARLQKEERDSKRGRLKVILGFAAGVGKTFSMLNEAKRRKEERRQDVVIGFVKTHGRAGTATQMGDLEIVPRKKIDYKGTTFEEMDTDAVIARHPQWVVVDELAHTNVPGSKHEKRYQDVLEIMDAGINVLSAMNVQHLESLNDTVAQITGVRVRETVPDWVLGEANEVVTVDISPRSLINRLQRGDIYAQDKVPQALTNFFTEGNLSALREIVLREVATEVDRSVQDYRTERRIRQSWQTHEKIMVCISPDKPSSRLLRRGWRIAHRLHADIVAVYVPFGKPTLEQQAVLENDFQLANRLSIRIERTSGPKVSEALAEYALKNQVTQIVIGHSGRTRWQEFWEGSIVTDLVRRLRGIDVLIVANTVEAE